MSEKIRPRPKHTAFRIGNVVVSLYVRTMAPTKPESEKRKAQKVEWQKNDRAKKAAAVKKLENMKVKNKISQQQRRDRLRRLAQAVSFVSKFVCC